MRPMRFGFSLLLDRDSLPNLHEFIQSIEQRSASLSAHRLENGPNAGDEMLVCLHQARVSGFGKVDKDLAAILLITLARNESALFKAIDGAHHRRGIEPQFCRDRADGIWFALSRFFDQTYHHKMRRAEPVLVRVFEARAQHLAQI